MAAATTSLFKTNSVLTTDSSSVFSLPSIIAKATKSSSLPSISCLSLPLKPIKLHLACSSSVNFFLPSFSVKKRPVLTFVASQEDSTVVLEEAEEEVKWENEESDDGAISGEFAEEGEGGEDVAEVEPPEEAKLFVGNLPYDVDSENLAELFNQAGVVEIAEVIYNRETDQSRGFGFVSMSTVEEAEKAVEMLNGYDIKGRLLTVNKAAPRGSRPERPPRDVEPSKRLYVGNLPWEVDNARLEQIFSEHGKVLQARVVFDRESGRSRGFGFVTMSTDAELQDAIVALDGKSLEGRAIRVNVAEERPRRNF